MKRDLSNHAPLNDKIDGGDIMSSHETSTNSAPTYRVPHTRIVSIEHPCIVHDFHSAFQSLGGEQQLKHVFEHDIGDSTDADVKQGVEPVVGVSLRPKDPLAKKISSTAISTGNVLVKVTLPKLTGRKRKRGSDGGFLDSPSQVSHSSACGLTAPDLLQRMRDNVGKVDVEAIGIITDTHRFNTLPDFQLQPDEVPIMREIQEHLIQPDYDKLMAFNVDVKPSNGESGNFPGPPNFATARRPAVRKTRRPQPTTPHRQGPHDLDNNASPSPPASPPSRLTGNTRLPPPQLRDILVDPLKTPIPTAPPTTLAPPPPNSLTGTLLTTLQTLLTTRPLLPRRTYWSHLQPHADKSIRYAVPHAAYYLDTTPWRYSIVAYGIDPRSNSSYAPYQTVSFSKAVCAAITSGSAYGKPSKHLRIFDGTRPVDPSDTWALCDFTEPLVARLVQTADLRAAPDEVFGWYFNGRLAKILVIVKEKMIAVTNPARKDNLSDVEYEMLAGLPDVVEKMGDCVVHGGRAQVRGLARAVEEEALRPTIGALRGFEPVGGVRRRDWDGLGDVTGVTMSENVEGEEGDVDREDDDEEVEDDAGEEGDENYGENHGHSLDVEQVEEEEVGVSDRT